jgi:hypothetical protein
MDEAPRPLPDEKNEAIRSRYIALMAPLFFPDDPSGPDIVRYFASLLRIVGMEDKGWDPYVESRAMLDDLYALMQFDFPADKFRDKELTKWRLGLIFYNHIVEMDAPYEVLTNLLRFRLGKGYSPNPYYDFLTAGQRSRFKKTGLFPRHKIDIVKRLSAEAKLETGLMFDEFYRGDLRNAISHSDFIFTDDGFRCRNGNWTGAFKITFGELDELLTKAKVYIGAFFGLEREARRLWGTYAGKGMPYDPVYKGIMEVLVDEEGLMNGFKVHWPNASESVYRRTKDGIEMTNCSLAIKEANISLFVDRYARHPGTFSPLVEADAAPLYTRLDGSDDDLVWPSSDSPKSGSGAM